MFSAIQIKTGQILKKVYIL